MAKMLEEAGCFRTAQRRTSPDIPRVEASGDFWLIYSHGRERYPFTVLKLMRLKNCAVLVDILVKRFGAGSPEFGRAQTLAPGMTLGGWQALESVRAGDRPIDCAERIWKNLTLDGQQHWLQVAQAEIERLANCLKAESAFLDDFSVLEDRHA